MCFVEEGTSNVDMIAKISAHSIVADAIRQILRARNTELPYVSCLKRPGHAVEAMQDVAWALIARGYPVNLEAANPPFGVEGELVNQ